MRLLIVLISVVFTFGGGETLVVAQNNSNVPSEKDNRVAEPKNYSTMVTDLFAPITATLNLTKEQEFQIVAIITEAEVKADSVMQRSVEIEQELIDSSFDDRFDEEKVRVLSEQQATMLTQLIILRVLTKAEIYKILTSEQRALVLQYFRPKAQLQGYLGSISIY